MRNEYYHKGWIFDREKFTETEDGLKFKGHLYEWADIRDIGSFKSRVLIKFSDGKILHFDKRYLRRRGSEYQAFVAYESIDYSQFSERLKMNTRYHLSSPELKALLDKQSELFERIKNKAADDVDLKVSGTLDAKKIENEIQAYYQNQNSKRVKELSKAAIIGMLSLILIFLAMQSINA